MMSYLNPNKYLNFFKNTKKAAHRVDSVKFDMEILFRELDYLRLEKERQTLHDLKGKFQGKRCFILGNGPSLNLSDIELLRNEHTFASNKIYLLFDQTEWRPTYYSVEDHLVLSQNFEEIEKVQARYKIFPNYPMHLAPSISGGVYFKLEYEDFFPEEPNFSIDALDKLYWGSSIVYTQMQLACHMGYSEVYLIGVDYTYVEPKEKHGNIMICEGEVNHFHKDYRKPGEKWYAPNLNYHEKSFTKAKSESEKIGTTIFNATRGGKLEIFKRVDLDSLF